MNRKKRLRDMTDTELALEIAEQRILLDAVTYGGMILVIIMFIIGMVTSRLNNNEAPIYFSLIGIWSSVVALQAVIYNLVKNEKRIREVSQWNSNPS